MQKNGYNRQTAPEPPYSECSRRLQEEHGLGSDMVASVLSAFSVWL